MKDKVLLENGRSVPISRRLRNVREIVLKYQGELNYEVREGRFVVEILI